MDQSAFEQVTVSFAAFHAEFAPLFGRTDTQRRSEQYLRGLLVPQTDRRNAENMAETIDGATPRTLQRLLTEAPWQTGPVIDRLQGYVGVRLNEPMGVFVIDESGFPKQGTHSVGVARQYCGTLGKVANCRMGVFLAYASSRGQALVDMRLFLPNAWTEDRARCQGAGVPDDVEYQSKAALGLAMLRQAKVAGHLEGEWVAGDDAYGMVPTLRDALDAEGWRYVLDVPKSTPVFVTEPQTVLPPWSGRGHRPTKLQVAPGAPPAQTVETIATTLPAAAWQVLTVAEGAQGERTYLFVARRVWESRAGLPGRTCWLLLRRNLDGSESRYYLSNAPVDTALLPLAQVAATRWIIETEFKTAKGETGLDEYEVRSWRSWHHPITLALLAGAFLLTLQQEWGGKSAPHHPTTNQPGAARAAAAARVHHRRVIRLAAGYPSAQRARQTLPFQTAPPTVA